MMFLWRSFLFLLLFLSTWCVYAGEIVAPGTFGTIQNAIDAAQSGDTVILAPGEYTENLKLKSGVSLTAQEPGKSVIHAAIPSTPTLRLDNCFYNTISGLVFTGPADTVVLLNRSQVSLEKCTVSGGVYGLVLARGGSSTVQDCTVSDNSRVGIFVLGATTSPRIEQCTSARNRFAGIFVAERAGGRYETNTCTENGVGLIVSRGSTVCTKGNVLCKNRGAGSFQSMAATLEEGSDRNQIHDNGEICAQEMATLFEQGEFDKLEAIAQRLNEKRTHTLQGYPELDFFYDFNWYCDNNDTKGEAAFLDRMKQWEAKYPQSITRRILLAKAYHGFAIRERQANYSKEQQEKVQDYMSKAYAVFEDTLKLSPKDPELFLVAMNICIDDRSKISSTGSAFLDAIKRMRNTIAIEGENPAVEKWFAEGVQCDLGYIALYTKRAQQLISTIDDKPNAVAEFASMSADNRKGEEGDILYMMIAMELMNAENCEDYVETFSLDWARIKRGINVFFARYPDAWGVRHIMCRLACLYDDRETAANLFSGCIERSGGLPWVNTYQFDTWKKWALKNEPKPLISSAAIAVKYSDIDEVRQFLDEKGDINQVGDTGYSLLTLALWYQNDEIVRLLLDRGCDINNVPCNELTPLTLAINNGNEDIINLLLAQKPNVNLATEYGWTPFLMALEKKNAPLSNRLLEMGADPNRAMPFGSTPLAYALRYNLNDLAKALIDRGVDVNACGVDGERALIFAAAQGKVELCNLLFAHGVDPKGKSRMGRAPVGAAAKSGNLEVVKLILEKGGDPLDYRSPDGWSILHSAVDSKSKDVIAYVLDHVSVSSLDQIPEAYLPTIHHPETYLPILHHAVKKGDVEVVKLLLTKKPNINLRNKDGKTPLSFAIAAKNEPMIALLREQGATE